MAGFNRVIIVGNLTRDPEYRQLASGQAVCRLGIATNRQFKNKQSGSMVQEVCYIDVDVWGPQAESCRQYLQKGRSILVEGRLKLDNWEDQNGQARSKHSIVADRVVFLSNGASESTSQGMMPSVDSSFSGNLQDVSLDADAALLEQFEKAQTKVRAIKQAREKKDSPSTGEIDFQDEQPFEDNLPF